MGLTHALTAGNHRGRAMVVAGVFALSAVSVIAVAATYQGSASQAPLATSVVTTTPSPTPPPTTGGIATIAATATPTQPPEVAVPSAPEAAVPAPAERVVPAPRPRVVPAPRSNVFGRGTPMPASLPVALVIPAIGVNSSGMLHLGQTARGALQVPAPGPDYDKVAWYRNSPIPGSLGPAVLVGHIDSARNGPSVFARLGALRRGNLVRVTRADSTVAVFRVDDVRRFRKSGFPTKLVYGNTDYAALRIITCGGPFDPTVGHYVDNIVVLASLVR